MNFLKLSSCGIILFLVGCAHYAPIQKGLIPLSERIDRSRKLVERRRKEALLITLKEKAEILKTRLYANFLADHSLLVKYKRDELPTQGHFEYTTDLLATLAFEYGTTKDPTVKLQALRVIMGLIEMDRSNGTLDGFIPYIVKVENEKLVVVRNDAHSNVYAQLMFSYSAILNVFDDSILTDLVKSHIQLVVYYFLKTDMILKDLEGNKIEHSNLNSKSGSRKLDAMIILETGLAVMDPSSILYKMTKTQYDKFVKKGYKKSGMKLHIRILIWEIPSHSTDWLNFTRLYSLVQTTDSGAYKKTVKRLYKSQRKECNPFFDVVYMSCLKDYDLELKKRVKKFLLSFPLNLDQSEIINSRNKEVKLRWIPVLTKGKYVAEVKKPLLIYQRPLSNFLWKRNPYQVDDNFNCDDSLKYSGIDYLLAYWMCRYHGVVSIDD